MPQLRSGRSTTERDFQSAAPSVDGENGEGQDMPQAPTAAFEALTQPAKKPTAERVRRRELRLVLQRKDPRGHACCRRRTP